MGIERSLLFAGFDAAERRDVLMRCRRRRFRAGAFIFHEGEAGDTIHVIDRGLVAVLSGHALGDPVMLRVLGPHEVFGEQALLSARRTRMATVQALLATETMALSRTAFEELRQRHPSVERFLVAILAAEVRRLSQQIVELTELPAPIRVYRRIVSMAELFDATQDGAAILLAQHHLASLAYAKLRVTNRVLAEARRDGVVETARRRIVVLDWDRLRARARLPRTAS
jgi:CRP-like cAMP-binding protein